MSRHYQENELEFNYDSSDDMKFPEMRGIVIRFYGGTIEEAITKARKQFNLSDQWKVISVDMV